MAWRFVRQPNGLLARFSDVVDDFTDYDLTQFDAYDLAMAEMGRDEARGKVERALSDEPFPPFVMDSGLNDGLDRWRAAIETVRDVHGDARAEERIKELGQT